MRLQLVHGEKREIIGLVFHREEGIPDEKAMDGLLCLADIVVDGESFLRSGSGDGTGRMPWMVEFKPLIERTQEARIRNAARQASPTDQALTEEDWDRIFSLPFLDDQRAILGLFKTNGNKNLWPDKIRELLPGIRWRKGSTFTYSRMCAINRVFCVTHSKYRLSGGSVRQRGVFWTNRSIRIFIVEYGR